MNSEELEVSLREEFENYLKGVRDEMRQQAVELHSKIEAEIDSHRSNLAEAFKSYSERFDSEQRFDEAFNSSVLEHLRLARDEGSRLAANAMVEAEALEKETAAPADFTGIRDAATDITSQDSQSAILKSLVNHAAEFAPRGAFFIIKNEHFVGWKVFGDEGDEAEGAIRDIHFPVAANSILGEAIRSLSTKEGSFGGNADDTEFLDPLQYGQPDRMYAIPLVARGRGVAVMYVDYGSSGVTLNVEALETLVRMAGLTVELHAASQSAKAENSEAAAADFEDTRDEYQETAHHEPFDEAHHAFDETPTHEAETSEPEVEETPEHEAEETPAYAFDETPQPETAVENTTDEYPGNQTVEFGAGEFSPAEATSDFAFSTPVTADEPAAYDEPFGGYAVEEHTEFEATEDAFGEEQEHVDEPVREPAPEYQSEPIESAFGSHDAGGEMVFDSGGSIEKAAEISPFDAAAAPEFEPAVAGVSAKPESSIEVSPANTGFARLSDRPVDLPIEVAEDERRLHNDARRFARLLVSEIKLYNEKKVQEGRQERDLYERLREAIDRSREMYDKRVQPPVAAKFDYFHYELVNALADGEADRLGTGYPGSRV